MRNAEITATVLNPEDGPPWVLDIVATSTEGHELGRERFEHSGEDYHALLTLALEKLRGQLA